MRSPSSRRLAAGLRHHAVPETLHPVQESARPGRMLAGVVTDEGGFELFQQHALFGGEVDRRFDHDLAVQVPCLAAAYRLDALVAQAEYLAGLGFGRHPDFRFAAQRGHPHDVPKRRLRDADRDVAMQIVAVALEDVVRAHADFDVKVAGRRTGRAGLALARQTDAITIVDACRNLDRQDFLFLDPTVAVAGLAWIGDGLSTPAAMRTGLLHGEDAALHAYLATPMAGRAGIDFAVLRATALAGFADSERGDLDPLFDTGDGFLEVEFHHIADVGTTTRTAPGATATKDVAEDVTEDIAHVAEAGPRAAATHAVLERGVALLVVHPALTRVRQHFVGFLALLEGFEGDLV